MEDVIHWITEHKEESAPNRKVSHSHPDPTADEAISNVIREEGKKKWDAQRSIKFVNKLKRKKAIGMLPDVIPQENAPAGNASSAPASEEA